MHEKKKFRTALSLMVSFFLAAFLSLLFLSLELAFGYFNENEFQKALQSSGYSAEMENAVETRLKELFASQEMPEALVDQVLGEKDLHVLFHNYSEMGAERFQEDFQGGFQAAIDNYLQGTGVQETENIKSSMEILAKEAAAICERAVYPGFITNYYGAAKSTQRSLLILAAVSLALSAACVVALLSMYHYKHRAVRYMAYSAIGATLFNIIALLYLKNTEALQIAGVEPEYYHQFLEQYRTQGLSTWYVASGIGLALAIVLLLLMKRLKHTIQ